MPESFTSEQQNLQQCDQLFGAEVDMLCDLEQAQQETPGVPTEMDTEMGPSKAELLAQQKEKVRLLVLQYKKQLKSI